MRGTPIIPIIDSRDNGVTIWLIGVVINLLTKSPDPKPKS